jgi:hypothetical protein
MRTSALRISLLTSLLLLTGLAQRAVSQDLLMVDKVTTEKAFACKSSATVTVAAAATGKIIANVAGKTTYICGWSLSGDTAHTTAAMKYGTGTTCGTGTTSISGTFFMPVDGSWQAIAPVGTALVRVAAGKDFCIAAVTGAVNGVVFYNQF